MGCGTSKNSASNPNIAEPDTSTGRNVDASSRPPASVNAVHSITNDDSVGDVLELEAQERLNVDNSVKGGGAAGSSARPPHENKQDLKKNLKSKTTEDARQDPSATQTAHAAVAPKSSAKAPAPAIQFSRVQGVGDDSDDEEEEERLTQLLDVSVTFAFSKLKLQECIFLAEYVWIGGNGGDLRCKTRTLTKLPTCVADFPIWNYDGSSTNQAPGHDSEVFMVPVAFYKDPFREGNHFLVMCDAYEPPRVLPDGTKVPMKPLPTNTRAACAEVMEKCKDYEPWFGIEQEYGLMHPDTLWPLGWPHGGFPGPQGPYYCGAGTGLAIGRDVVEAHYRACVVAGIKVSGINAEVMPGQWEYQVGPCIGMEAGDMLWMSRYIMLRVCEMFNVVVTYDPKPVAGDWNGAGCHTNYSTVETRAPGGWAVIQDHMKKLEARHMQHMIEYGEGNERRLTGRHETAPMDKFSWGVANRGSSIRVPRSVPVDGCGYYEDRRPASNMDPYTVTRLVVETTILGHVDWVQYNKPPPPHSTSTPAVQKPAAVAPPPVKAAPPPAMKAAPPPVMKAAPSAAVKAAPPPPAPVVVAAAAPVKKVVAAPVEKKPAPPPAPPMAHCGVADDPEVDSDVEDEDDEAVLVDCEPQLLPLLDHTIELNFKNTCPYKDNICLAEYVWIGGNGGDLRCKTRTLTKPATCLADFPIWNYDGSSTNQAPGHDSEVFLQPVAYYPDPFRGGKNNFLVMCEALEPPRVLDDGTMVPMKPIPSNSYHACAEAMKAAEKHAPWFGIEQEYTLLHPVTRWPLGWPESGFPGPQGPYYCSAGTGVAIGRDIVEAHNRACLYAGISVSGINAEVMPGQWEYQVGPCKGIDAGNMMWMTRYIMLRVGELFNVEVSFDPKPIEGDWNGAGCHTNYSTVETRAPGGWTVMQEHMKKLEARHMQHMTEYGEGNERRLTGRHETAPMDKFSWGVANRGSSIRVPRSVPVDGCGYYEDRRPASNMDPYLVTRMIVETTLLLDIAPIVSPPKALPAPDKPKATPVAQIVYCGVADDPEVDSDVEDEDDEAVLVDCEPQLLPLLDHTIELNFKNTCPYKDNICLAEYVWIGGNGGDLRCKTRTLTKPATCLADFPIWNYDGSSTNQAPGHDSEVFLQPVAYYPDPFRGGKNNFLVMCEALEPPRMLDDGTMVPMKPIPSNSYHACAEVMKRAEKHAPWFGIEQEYTLLHPVTRWPLGWPESGFPGPQGPYYCSAGTGVAIGRDIVEVHNRACLYAGISVSGINAEVMPGQWEYQVGPCSGIDAGNMLWMSRYLMLRVGELFNVEVSFDPKPIEGDWNGAGCHTNYSTVETRAPGGWDVTKEHMKLLENNHMAHMVAYGEGNERRLTGRHETAPMDKFSWGVANRGSSIRVPRSLPVDGCGYYEDRRPASNMDPYLVTRMIVQTTVLKEAPTK